MSTPETSHLLQSLLDASSGSLVLTLDALRVDPQEDRDAVAGPLGHLSGGTPPFNQVDTHAWRRSYTRLASGEAYSAGVSAFLRPCPTLGGTWRAPACLEATLLGCWWLV